MAVSEEIQKQVLAEATSATPNYEVNYDDPRFGKVESEENQALTELEQTYGGMIADTDKYYDAQIQASKDWANKQTQLQQEQTDFAIEQIEQQKDQAQKDYTKEQSGAYVDWQKQSNAYGTEAEKIAANGLTNTGYSESSQVSMYNTYQNRVSLAREGLTKAMLNYDNAIKDAILQNNATMAEIAYTALQQQLELSLQGFQYKNQLLLEQSDKKLQIKQHYDDQWQKVLDNIYRENELTESVRQYEKSFAEDVRQFESNQAWQTEQNRLNRDFEAEQAVLERDFKAAQAELDRKFEADQAELDRKFKADQEELNRKHDREMLDAKTEADKELLREQHKNDMAKLDQQHKNDMAKLNQQHKNDKDLLNYQYSLKGSSSGSSGSSSGSSGINKSSSSTKKSGSSTKVSSSGRTHGGGGGSFGNYTPTYEDAVAYMKQNGVPSYKASGMMTRNEWSRRQSSRGTTKSSANTTYEDYIISYVNRAIG